MEAVETKKDEIQAHMEKYKQKELEEFENDVLSEAFVKIQSKISELNTRTEKELSDITSEYKRKLYELSGEYFEKIFLEVMERLVTYTDTDEYKAKLLENISSLPKHKNSTIIITEKDECLKEDIKNLYGENVNIVCDDNMVLIGGFIFLNKENNIKNDQSLFVKFENQKKWFYENSGLIPNNK